jgi:hypothetical protein
MEKTKLSRRNFLLAVGATGAAGAAAIAAKSTGQQTPGTTVKEEKRTGYQLSEHVRNYYRTTQV